MRRDKRRSSAAGHIEPAMSTVKRAKTTTNTYSTKKPTADARERENFSNMFGQDATAPNTSPSIRFSDHSGAKNSSGLPAGSLRADFAHHEPAMFKESGSTIPDNESSHERMVEQALRSKSFKAPSSPGIKLVESDEMQKSSSFPWSASEQTPVARSNVARDEHATVPESGAENETIRNQHRDDSGQHTNVVPTNDDSTIPGPATAVMIAPSNYNEPHRSSPTVHINPVEISVASVAQPEAVSGDKPQKVGRGRKRKVQEESSEPLNSDDIAVGLPKERYVPRPSRRRATETLEEPIDFSVVPEKAAKSKRSKTLGSSANLAETQPLLASKDPSPKTERNTKLAKDLEAAEFTIAKPSKSVANDTLGQSPVQIFKSSPVVEVPATTEAPAAELKESTPHSATKVTSEDKKAIILQDDLAFAKPAPKKKLASKSKRSATTIFEDHVEFAGKFKSPSLSQQQAMRKSALVDVKNDASPAKRKRSGKAVITDDDDDDEEENLPVKPKRTRKAAVPDDDEDELAFDPQSQDEQADEPPDEPPKKRGRGRPSKAAAKADAEAAAKSAEQQEHANGDDNVQPAPEKPTKKRRGRPPKSAAAVPAEDESKDAEDTSNDQPQQNEDKDKPSTEKFTETPAADSTQAKANSATVIPTPSPEKQPSVETKAVPDKKTKASPAAHSPIKSSSPAPYRVGLSKKHRIPSLLRVMRPPPAKLPSKR